MQAKRIDFTRSIFLVSGSNLAFESKEMVWKYVTKKWGTPQSDLRSFSCAAGGFESGAEVQTLNMNGQEVKILCRRVVTDENLDAAIAQGW
jgi:hypothetical protein